MSINNSLLKYNLFALIVNCKFVGILVKIRSLFNDLDAQFWLFDSPNFGVHPEPI